jgi:DnaK suppressor protein
LKCATHRSNNSAPPEEPFFWVLDPCLRFFPFEVPVMKSEELNQFRGILKVLQARLRGDVEQLTEEAFSGSESSGEQRSSNHMAEMGSDAWDLDFSLQLVETDQGVLEEISHALKKIDDGTYGLCEVCVQQGKPETKSRIPKARLMAIPHARNCVECERVKESRR